MPRVPPLLLALLLAGCLGAPSDGTGDAESGTIEAADDRAPSASAAPPASAASGEEAAAPLDVARFRGPVTALPTFDPACPPEPHGRTHEIPVAAGAEHLRFELVTGNMEIIEARARLLVGEEAVGEARQEDEPLVIDLDAKALRGATTLRAIVWFCSAILIQSYDYEGAASSFAAAPGEEYSAFPRS